MTIFKKKKKPIPAGLFPTKFLQATERRILLDKSAQLEKQLAFPFLVDKVSRDDDLGNGWFHMVVEAKRKLAKGGFSEHKYERYISEKNRATFFKMLDWNAPEHSAALRIFTRAGQKTMG